MERVIFILLAIFLTTSKCQICRKTEMVLKEVPVTYQYTYQQVIHDPTCWFINCMKTETKTAKDVNMVERYEPEEKYICCAGYEEITQNGNSTCQPKCSAPCQNGFCIKPETCSCNQGYIKDPLIPNICLPLCVVTATEDYCHSPDKTPESPFTLGYYDTDSCHHLCSEQCVNGFCISYDTCLCKPGFIKLDKFVCVNNCSDCECNEGWYYKDGACEPICEVPCGNGTCIARNTCDCVQGYELSNDTTVCQPICDCIGVCVAPNVCSCEMPFDIEIVDGKETCVFIETTTRSNETTADITEENITTTDNINAVTLIENEFVTKALSVDQVIIPANNIEVDNFLKKHWYYFLLSGIIVVIIIILIVCCVKRRAKVFSEDNTEVYVTYQNNP